MIKVEFVRLTFCLDLPLHTGLHMIRPPICCPTDQLEVLCDVVHLLPSVTSHDDVDVVAALIVHASKQH
jgi:hypothetical protein